MAKIHGLINYSNTTSIITESYDLSFEFDLLKCITELEGGNKSDNHILNELKVHVLPKRKRILSLLYLLKNLRNQVTKENHEKVVCHGDIWGGNLINSEGKLHFIDWEAVIFAPREYDLFNYIGDGFDCVLPSYEKHWGKKILLNPNLLRFYSYRQHLRNLTNWLMNILYRNTEDSQNENDLEMIRYHCTERLEANEPNKKNYYIISNKSGNLNN